MAENMLERLMKLLSEKHCTSFPCQTSLKAVADQPQLTIAWMENCLDFYLVSSLINQVTSEGVYNRTCVS